MQTVCILLESDPAWISLCKALDEDEPRLFRVGRCLSAEICSFCAEWLSPPRGCLFVAEPGSKPTAPKGQAGMGRWRGGGPSPAGQSSLCVLGGEKSSQGGGGAGGGGGGAGFEALDATSKEDSGQIATEVASLLPFVSPCLARAEVELPIAGKRPGLGIRNRELPALWKRLFHFSGSPCSSVSL